MNDFWILFISDKLEFNNDLVKFVHVRGYHSINRSYSCIKTILFSRKITNKFLKNRSVFKNFYRCLERVNYYILRHP